MLIDYTHFSIRLQDQNIETFANSIQSLNQNTRLQTIRKTLSNRIAILLSRIADKINLHRITSRVQSKYFQFYCNRSFILREH